MSSVGDRVDGRDDALVVRRQEAHERREQQRGVQRIGAVVLHEHAARVDAVLEHVGVDLVRRRLPAGEPLAVVAQQREPRAAIRRDPAHDLRRREVLRLAADLPDAAVGLAPVRQRLLDLVADERPHALAQPVARLHVQVERVEEAAPHVVLAVVVGAVADAHGRRVLVAREVREVLLLERALAADAVHDLQLVLLADLGEEVEEVVGLPVEAERVEAPEHERRVAHPGVAVVPVAVAAGRLGQRGRRGRDQRARSARTTAP